MKKGKAVGEERISVEMIETLEEFDVEKVTKMVADEKGNQGTERRLSMFYRFC